MVPEDRPKADPRTFAMPRHKWFIPLNHDISVLYTVGNMSGGNCGRGRTGMTGAPGSGPGSTVRTAPGRAGERRPGPNGWGSPRPRSLGPGLAEREVTVTRYPRRAEPAPWRGGW